MKLPLNIQTFEPSKYEGGDQISDASNTPDTDSLATLSTSRAVCMAYVSASDIE